MLKTSHSKYLHKFKDHC